jgi:subtilisin family serine protease
VAGDGFETDPSGRVRVIVQLSSEPAAQARFLESVDPTVRVQRRFTRLFSGVALSLDKAGLNTLHDQPGVRAVYPDALVQASLADSVPLIGAPQVWALTDDQGWPVTGQGIRVAIVDSGVDYTRAALGGCLGSGCRVIGGYDFVNEDADPWDDHGHGTHVAGIVAANSAARQGVAPGVELLAYKALDANGVGFASDIIAALEQAVSDQADVINLSLGALGTTDDPLSQAAQAAVEAGFVVVAAAGNGGPQSSTVEAPSIAPGVISVAASSKDDTFADFSSRGPVASTFVLKPDIGAPGVEISSTVPLTGTVSDPSGWLPANGTSMATPHVAGGAALLRQLHPDWTPLEVKAALMNYALDLEQDLFAQGAGRLDLLPAATASLLAVPGSLSFGLPLLDGTDVLTLSLRNVGTTSLTVTPTVSMAHTADGVGQPLSPTLPVSYASVTPPNVTLNPGGTHIISVTLDIPPDAADGHYQGRVRLQNPAVTHEASVPLAFTLLSRVTLRVLDETGSEITGWGHMAVLARIPDADFLISNLPLQLPATFTVPSGSYHAQAFGHFGLYDHLLIPGLPQQVPYAIIQAETIPPHQVQTITLDLADTRPYRLDATDVDGNPAFINAWAAAFRYHEGDAAWLTRLGQSYIRVLNTDLPNDWPAQFALRLSDTPPGIAFVLALQGASFSPPYREFVARHAAQWSADPTGALGFPLTGSADRVEHLAWEKPVLDASTPPAFSVSPEQVGRYSVRTSIPGLLEAPWTGWESSAEAWLYPPTGAVSGLEPIAPGLTRTLTVVGAHHIIHWAGDSAHYRSFQRPLYTPNWSQTRTWDRDPNVFFPDEEALQPLPSVSGSFTLGMGPLYPTLAFDNHPDAILMRHPLLSGASGTPVAWGTEAPTFTLFLDGEPVDTGDLPEYDWTPSPLRQWRDLPSGVYELTIDHADASSGNPRRQAPQVGAGTIRAGFRLTDSLAADLNPPQVLDFVLPQRFDPDSALTATWTLSDANPIGLVAAAQLGEAAQAPLAVEELDNAHYQARIEPHGALTISLTYTATDTGGNWLAWQAAGTPSALAQVPVALAFELDPPGVPWSSQPTTVRIVGSLLDAKGQSLAESPAWLHLRAGPDFVGYVRDLTGSPGSYDTGAIDFAWTFVPSDLLGAPGPLPVTLEFDVGLYSPRTVTRSLRLVAPLYLPIILVGEVP